LTSVPLWQKLRNSKLDLDKSWTQIKKHKKEKKRNIKFGNFLISPTRKNGKKGGASKMASSQDFRNSGVSWPFKHNPKQTERGLLLKFSISACSIQRLNASQKLGDKWKKWSNPKANLKKFFFVLQRCLSLSKTYSKQEIQDDIFQICIYVGPEEEIISG
jgi:hypothetical protein